MVYYRSSTTVIWEAFSRLIFLQYRRNLGSGRLGIYLCLGIRAVITVVVPCCITFQTSPVSQLTHAEPSPHGQSPARLISAAPPARQAQDAICCRVPAFF